MNLLKDSRQLVVQEPFRVRSLEKPQGLAFQHEVGESAHRCQASKDLRRIFEPSHIELRLSVIRGEFGHLLQNPSKTVLLKVRGQSMRDAGLLPNDCVVVLSPRRPFTTCAISPNRRLGTLLPARVKEASDMRVHVIVIQTKE